MEARTVPQRALFMSQPRQPALPKRSDADEEHDYPEKDRGNGVRTPLILIEVTKLEGRGLRQGRGNQAWGQCGRGIRGCMCMRGHRDYFRSVKEVCVSG